MHPGTIIFLIGPSASGKTTIQKRFQETSGEFYIRIGIDSFFDALLPEPDLKEFAETKQLWQKTKNGEIIRGIVQSTDEEGRSVIPLVIGPVGKKVMYGMHHAIAAYAQQGNNIIVDYILYDSSYFADIVDALKECKVYFVGIKTPLEILEERERKRATSPLGHARSHYDLLPEQITYDLTLDTSELTPDASVKKIQDFIQKHPSPKAFKEIQKSMSK